MRRKLQWLLVSRLIIASVLLGVVVIIEQGKPLQSFTFVIATVAAVVALLSLIYYFLFHTSVSPTFQVYLQLSVDLLLTTYLVYQTGDVESPFPPLYLVILFAAGALFGRRGVLQLAVLAGILYATGGALTIAGVVERATGWPPYENTRLPWVEFLLSLNLLAIFAVALLSSYLAERVSRSETELAAANKDLADYRLFNDRIIESIRSGLVTTDLQGNIVTFNRAAEEITGHKAQDVRGRSIISIFGDIEKQIEAGLESLRNRTRLPRFDIACRTADGRELHLGFSVAPLVDEADGLRGYVLTFQDLTEVMELEREVRRQERLAALGKMAAGLAHEIRNPLASMRGSVQVLASELNLSVDQSQLMEIVLRESDRLNRIVSDFLVYARPPRIERTVVDLTAILSETIALLRNSPELRPDHHILFECPATQVHYNGDANQIRQIFWNLARNAIQAMPNGGELRVVIDASPVREVTITFSDTGEGMSREQKERMFEPFNSSTGGTGLGMAIVYQLVRDHNGKIVVESDEGKGTQVAIKLPEAGRVARSSGSRTAQESAGVESSREAAVRTV
jgi:two-component system sensor histidine kinase PilS (NtrC family)